MVTMPSCTAVSIGRESRMWCSGIKYTEVPAAPLVHMGLQSFRIGMYPVTNQDYRCFIESEGYGEQRWWGSSGGKLWSAQNELFVADLAARIEEEIRFHYETRNTGWPDYSGGPWWYRSSIGTPA